MTLCPYCNKFQPTTRCQVPHCGGFVCPCCSRCNRAEKFSPAAHAALGQQAAPHANGRLSPDGAKADEPGSVPEDTSAAGADEQEALADLRWHWEEAYEINRAGQTWTARFKADTATLSADSADELRKLIRQDYFDRKTLERSGQATAGTTGDPVVGAGERALRLLRDEGVI